jgi:predicted adenylyl cyclase CyaB
VTEIEMKARVQDPEAMKAAISALGEYDGDYLKDDRYYCAADDAGGGPSGAPAAGGRPAERARFRLRQSEGTAVVTYKKKRLEGNHEVNEEQEFTVSDGERFHALMEELGFRVCARKEKRGSQYHSADGTGIELAKVEGLGWFLEIEALIVSRGTEEIAAAKERVARLFRRLGVSEEQFERRYYIDMLAEEAGKDSSDGNT